MAAAQLRAPLYEDKVVDFLFDKAEVTEREVTQEELEAAIEAEETAEAKPAKKKPAAKKAPSGPVRYRTAKESAGRLLVGGIRPSMPTIPGICYYLVPEEHVKAFESSKDFMRGVVVRDE